jgi:hypothetical protein
VKIGKRQRGVARGLGPSAWTTQVTGNDSARVRIAANDRGPWATNARRWRSLRASHEQACDPRAESIGTSSRGADDDELVIRHARLAPSRLHTGQPEHPGQPARGTGVVRGYRALPDSVVTMTHAAMFAKV